jgi:hypothetical protein
MADLFTADELWVLSKKYPKEIALLPLPSLDEIVVEFLSRHDVFISPVSSKTGPGALTNAAMGAMGPGYLAANTHLTQQQKSAALQEWTSWKQWALSHKDFPDFKESVLQKYEQKKRDVDLFLTENYDSLQGVLKRYDEVQKKGEKQTFFAISILAVIVSLFALFGFLTANTKPDNNPSPQEKTEVYP